MFLVEARQAADEYEWCLSPFGPVLYSIDIIILRLQYIKSMMIYTLWSYGFLCFLVFD